MFLSSFRYFILLVNLFFMLLLSYPSPLHTIGCPCIVGSIVSDVQHHYAIGMREIESFLSCPPPILLLLKITNGYVRSMCPRMGPAYLIVILKNGRIREGQEERFIVNDIMK